MRSVFVVLMSLSALMLIGSPASAAPKKFSEAEVGRMKYECRAEQGRGKNPNMSAIIRECVERKKMEKK